MRSIRFLLFAVSLSLPIAVIAADTTPYNLIDSALSETRPVNFDVTITRQVDGMKTVFKATGAREGESPDKFWANIKLDRETGAGQVRLEVEARRVRGNVYLRVIKAQGTDPMLDIPAFQSLGNGWYSIPMAQLLCGCWTTPALDSGLVNQTDLQKNRFATGNGYKFSISDTSLTTLIDALTFFIPDGIQSEILPADLSAAVKIDTIPGGDFRFLSVTGSDSSYSVSAKLQRQMHSVNVETPKKVNALSDESLQTVLGFTVPEQSGQASSVGSGQSSSAGTNFDVGTELNLPSDVSSASVRRLRRQTGRYLTDLFGPDGSDHKLTVRVVTNPITWESLSAFQADFQPNSGILYVYNYPQTPSFSSKDIFQSLDVIFFDSSGQFVSSISLDRCMSPVCPGLTPPSPVSFALEVPGGFIKNLNIGPLWRLSLRRYPLTLPVDNGRQVIDYTAIQNQENQRGVPPPVIHYPQPVQPGYEALDTLAALISGEIRPADIRETLAQDRPGTKVFELYNFLSRTLKAHPEVTYLYLVRPTDKKDVFQLMVDSFSFAPTSVLDVNNNGKVDADEMPVPLGTRFEHSLYTTALSGPVLDTTLGADIAIYVPVRDENGATLAVLGVVESKDGSLAEGAGQPAN